MNGLRSICRTAVLHPSWRRTLSSRVKPIVKPLPEYVFAVRQNEYFNNQKRLIFTSSIRFADHQPFTLKTVEDRIMLVLSLYDKIDPNKLTMDTDFFKDAGLDSLDFVEVIIALEDEFHFEIPDGDSDRFKTPRDIFQYICDKLDVYE